MVTVSDIVKEECKYDISEKGINKIIYMASKSSVNIPYFWYKFGPVATKNAKVSNLPNKETNIRKEINAQIEEYYDKGLEQMTDEIYDNAPYEVQEYWRQIDKYIKNGHSEYNSSYSQNGEFSENLWQTYNKFPTNKFPKMSNLLDMWYNTMDELNAMDNKNYEDMMEVNMAFWDPFSIMLARNHNQYCNNRQICNIVCDSDSFNKEYTNKIKYSERRVERIDNKKILTEKRKLNIDEELKMNIISANKIGD